jgi:lipoic acid synthetase
LGANRKEGITLFVKIRCNVKIGHVEQNVKQNKNGFLQIIDCGLVDYREVLQTQHELRDKRREGKISDTVLIVEHPPVITLGARQNANQLLSSKEDLAKRYIDVVDTRRGGGVTAHNPGQLVFYPIMNLQELGLGITEYIRKLETIGIELLRQLGIHCQRRKGFPGLWIRKPKPEDERRLATEDTEHREKELKLNSALSAVKEKRDTRYEIRDARKIASIGVRVSKSVTYHGMAINIQNDLSIFDFLIPCGIDDVEMTSVLKETGKYNSMSELKQSLSKLLKKHFSKVYQDSEDRLTLSPVGRITSSSTRKLPSWLHRPLPASRTYKKVENILSSLNIETICHNANCPNRGQCWSRGTATVLILGNICTRNCKFCSVATGKPAQLDTSEVLRLAKMAKQMRLKYLVITSVNRDDLPDGGASHFRDCINYVRKKCPDIKLEILTPDFRNHQEEAVEILCDALPFIFAHNVETVPSLYPVARAGGNYQRSLNLLKIAKQNFTGVQTKSSIMLGLGETDAEVEQVLEDLRSMCCDRITIGQYLKPSKNSLEVVEYVTPAKFNFWRQKAIDLGFSWIISSPFARSSYFAEKEHAL